MHCYLLVLPLTTVELLYIHNTVDIDYKNPSNCCSRKQFFQSDNKRTMIIKHLWVRAKLAKFENSFINMFKSKLESKTLEKILKS